MTYASAVAATFALGVLPAGISLLPAAPSPSVGGTTYYLSATGNDANTGITPTSPWLTLSRADRVRFHAGDRLLLAGGDSFSGNLEFDANEAGTSTEPITVGTYGAGQATIQVRVVTDSAILVDGSAGFVLRNLNLVGPGMSTSTKPGVLFYDSGSSHLRGITITNVSVQDFHQGIVIGADGRQGGFDDIRMSSVSATDNAEAGIETFGHDVGAIRNVAITDASVSRTMGVPGTSSSTGNGIVLGDVDGGLVADSVAFDNGVLDDTTLPDHRTKGPAGIWAYASTRVSFVGDDSYDNSTGNRVDGDGFDFDQGVTDSVMEYNYSYGNAGAGYLLDGTSSAVNRNNTIRYNVSDYDGWNNSYGGLDTIGAVQGAMVYNNSVAVSAFSGSRPTDIRVSTGADDDAFWNNLLTSFDGLPQVEVADGTGGLRFGGNDYWSYGRPFLLDWRGHLFHDLPSWRAGTGQERVRGADTGSAINPEVINEKGGGPVASAREITAVDAFKLRSTSPLRDRGLDLAAAPFDVAVGSRDFWGDSLHSGSFSVGADQAPTG
jgi:hypothetical protein